jgi:hypothetical protein
LKLAASILYLVSSMRLGASRPEETRLDHVMDDISVAANPSTPDAPADAL